MSCGRIYRKKKPMNVLNSFYLKKYLRCQGNVNNKKILQKNQRETTQNNFHAHFLYNILIIKCSYSHLCTMVAQQFKSGVALNKKLSHSLDFPLFE